MTSLTILSDGKLGGRRVFAGGGRPDGHRAFYAAVRHSRRVRVLRVAVPVAVLLAVAGAIGFATLSNPLQMLSKMPVDLGSLVVSGTKIMMQQPRIAGFTRDNRRYDLTAQAAGQDLTKPDVVELHGIQASMEMLDKSLFQTTARSGLFNTKSEQLTLSQNIMVTSTSGYQAVLSEAVVDIRAGKIVSEKPVEVTTSSWTVNANRMEIGESGNLVRFERGVAVLLLPESYESIVTGGVR
jgi:lipopolysaccharide export system protein LptC